jgi:hypothetical protein
MKTLLLLFNPGLGILRKILHRKMVDVWHSFLIYPLVNKPERRIEDPVSTGSISKNLLL